MMLRPMRIALLLAIVVGCEAAESPISHHPKAVIEMHPAILVGDDPDWRQEVRRRLGCDPCETLNATLPDGVSVTAHYARNDPMRLAVAGNVESAEILATPGSKSYQYLLTLILTPAGVARITELAKASPTSLTVNEVSGLSLGANSLFVAHDLFGAGNFEDVEAATAAAKALGVPFLLKPATR